MIAVSVETAFTWIAITNIRGVELAHKRLRTDVRVNPKEYLSEIAKESKVLLWENHRSRDDILGMGICVPGIVDRKRGLSLHAYGIWKEKVPVQSIMEELMHCPVIVENNVKAFAEGELTKGMPGDKGFHKSHCG